MTTRAARALKPLPGAGVDESRTRIYYWWLLLVLFFEYVRPGTFIPPLAAAKVGTILPAALLLMVMFAPGLRPWKEIFSDRYAKWLIAFVVLVACSLPFAEVTMYAWDTLNKVLTQCTLFLMIARVATSLDRLRGIFATLIVAHVLLIALNPALVLNPEVRSYVTGAPFLGDGNDFSLSLCILLPLAIERARHSTSKFGRIFAWSAVVFILLAILGTQSRGASLAVAAVLGFLWLLSKQKLVGLLGIAAVGVLVLVFASDAYFNRMATIANYQEEGSAAARINAWKAAVNMAIDNPIMGVGAGHFPNAYGTRYRGEAGGRWMTAHSMYFLILGELGLPGIVVLCALVFGSILALLKLRRRLLAASPAQGPPEAWRVDSAQFLYLLAAGCLGFAVAGAFLSVAYYPHLYVLTAVTGAARLIVQQQMQGAAASASPTPATTRAATRASTAAVARGRRTVTD